MEKDCKRMNTTTVTELYLEVEAENLRPSRTKLYYTCKCGSLVLKRKHIRDKDFGFQRFCDKCKSLIYTVGRKVTYREYVSGK